MVTTTNEKPDARIIEKIQKLLRFAGDSRGNPNEVARAAAQAEAMLRKYNLEMTEVILQDMQNNVDAITDSTVFLRYRVGKVYHKIPAWAQWIAVGTAELFDCHVKMSPAVNAAGKYEFAFRFFGYHTDLQIVSWMMDYLLAEIYRAGKDHPNIKGIRGAESFRLGAANIIASRLQALKRERDAAYQQSSSGTALVLRKRDAITEKYGEFGYGKAKNRSKIDPEAYHAGCVAGSKVNLTPNPIENKTVAGRLK